MELEIRAKIENLKKFESNLMQLEGIKRKEKTIRQVDTYIKHSKDETRKLVFRIRRKQNSSILTLKTKSEGTNDTQWHDIDIPCNEPDKLEDILMNSGYEYVVLIDKIRDSYSYLGFEINIDNIRDLGQFVEIEALIDDTPNDTIALEKEMQEILKKLGINENDILKKGYVPLMLEKNAA